MIVDKIARDLCLRKSALARLAASASHRYKIYTIPKRSGGERVIHHPSRSLKLVQRYLNSHVFHELPIHDAATAYRRGSNIVNNALRHLKRNYLLRIDLKDFFPSITENDFTTYAAKHSQSFKDFGAEDFQFAAQIAFRFGRLTIGAPSSPILANVLCYSLDASLHEAATNMNIVYSRYADDLYFSCNETKPLNTFEKHAYELIKNSPCPRHLSPNHAKTIHMSRKGHCAVTGIVLTTQGGISIGRERKRRIRAMLHKVDSLSSDERRRLCGYLSFVKLVEPDYHRQIEQKLGPDKLRSLKSIE